MVHVNQNVKKNFFFYKKKQKLFKKIFFFFQQRIHLRKKIFLNVILMNHAIINFLQTPLILHLKDIFQKKSFQMMEMKMIWLG